MLPQIQSWLKTYGNRRILVVFLLGFSSGLPLALVGGTLQAWFKTSGASIAMIGWTTLVMQPYSYKFFWAPLLDRFAPLSSLDRRRGWLLLSQFTVIVLIVAMAFFNPQILLYNFPVILGLAFLLSVCSATQDIAIDAYRTELLHSDERGLGTAIAVEGYRIAMLASGGFALLLADKFGWQQTYLIMSGLMSVGLLATALAPKAASNPEINNKKLPQLIVSALLNFLTRKKAVWFLVLVVIYKLSDCFAHVLSSTFLLDLNFSLSEVGLINKVFGLFATLIGILLGGIFMTRVGLFKALLTFSFLSAITNLFYMLLAITGKNMILACSGVFVESICGGMGTAALVTLTMSLCDKKYTATQFALLTSLSAIGRIYVGPVAGHTVEHVGWASFYLLTATIALPSLILLVYMRSEIETLTDTPESATVNDPQPHKGTAVAVP